MTGNNILLWPSQGTNPRERLDRYKYIRIPSQGVSDVGVGPPPIIEDNFEAFDEGITSLDIPIVFEDDLQLSNPIGMELDSSGIIHTANSGAPNILRIDPITGIIDSYTTGNFVSPFDVDIDNINRKYVCDISVNKIFIFDNTNSLISEVTIPSITGAAGISISDNFDLVIVGDTTNHIVVGLRKSKLDLPVPEVEVVFTIGTTGVSGSADNQLDMPISVIIDPVNGNIIIADRINDRIQTFRGDGSVLLRSITGLTNLRYLALDNAGKLYIAEFTAVILVIDKNSSGLINPLITFDIGITFPTVQVTGIVLNLDNSKIFFSNINGDEIISSTTQTTFGRIIQTDDGGNILVSEV